MSYRTFKHLLGETSLERKCRFIFGGGILVLVTFSFYWYGQKTESLVIGQTTQTARMLINPILKDIHAKDGLNPDYAKAFDGKADAFTPLDDLQSYEFHVINPYNTKDKEKQPRDSFEAEAIQFAASLVMLPPP